MNIKSNHLTIDAFEVNDIKDIEKIKNFLHKISEMIKLNVLNKSEHYFPNGGFTSVYLLSESHMSIHTWIDEKYFSFDLFHCSDFDYESVIELVKKEFNCKIKFRYFNRLEKN